MTAEQPSPAGQADLEQDIAQTRERIGESIDQLGEKLNVRYQARRAADDVKASAINTAQTAKDAAASRARTARDQLQVVSQLAVAQARSRPNKAAIAAGVLAAASAGAVMWIRSGR